MWLLRTTPNSVPRHPFHCPDPKLQPKAWLCQDTTFGEQLAENFTTGSICLMHCDLGATLLSLASSSVEMTKAAFFL